jgi:very-short-patch-repair endonuclease
MGEFVGEIMTHRRTTPKIFQNSQELRKNPTAAELSLWQALHAHQVSGVHFRRQHAIGPYIVDFCSPRHKLIVEVDGGQHLDQQDYDAERTRFLESKGYRVLRFWNSDVLNNLNGVVMVIMDALDGEGTDPL